MRIYEETYTEDTRSDKDLSRRYYPFEKLTPGYVLEVIVAKDYYKELHAIKTALNCHRRKNNKNKYNYKIKSNLSFIKIYCIS